MSEWKGGRLVLQTGMGSAALAAVISFVADCALAATPNLECATPSGEVETRICGDPIGPVRFRCDDGSEIVATFYRGDPPGARLERGGEQVVLLQGRSGSGARYLGDGVLFWNKGRDASVDWRGQELACTEAE